MSWNRYVMKKIWLDPSSHPALKTAALRLSEFYGAAISSSEDQADCLLSLNAWKSAPSGRRYFAVFRKGEKTIFTGDRPASLLAGALYLVHHESQDRKISLPLERVSPFAERLVMEDFPFHCYAPRGFEIPPERYAENLAALGFTAMECNRFSKEMPLEPFWWNYYFTNPSPAPFVWTKWHEGVWERSVVEANAAELRRTIAAATAHGLEPTITTFLPRPYPEYFFQKHPQLRGPTFRHGLLAAGGHAAASCLDTDNSEAQEFYREVYQHLFGDFPGIRQMFFWHGDLGTQFWGDGQGSKKLRLAQRVAGFHRMLGGIIRSGGHNTQVWLNPWALHESCFEELNELLPSEVGYSIKDNPGLETFSGTSPDRLGDATVLTASLGEVPKKIFALAQKSGRRVCLGQYQDSSEDLDPLLALPHPIMTFRKFKSLAANPSVSAAHWGVIPRDKAPVNLNQDVMRELTWGTHANVFPELFESLFPPQLSTSDREAVYAAWRKIDTALQIWPQFWGLRLQDSGVRLRWLVRPFGPGIEQIPESERSWYLDYSIYRITKENPLEAYVNFSAAQAYEVQALFTDMCGMLVAAEKIFAEVSVTQMAPCAHWLESQAAVVKILRLFWTTYENLYRFAWLQASDRTSDNAKEIRAVIQKEIANVHETVAHLQAYKGILIRTHEKWGHCFGPDLEHDLESKIRLMMMVLEDPANL